MSSSLKISQPDLVEGRDGLELRGVIWNDHLPETSYFIMKWDVNIETLLLELEDGSSIALELKTVIGTALRGIPTSFTAKGTSKGRRIVVSWNMRGYDGATISKRVGEAFGAGWEDAAGKLLAARPRNDQLQLEVLWCGVPRDQIPWFPMVDSEKCDGCGKCVEYCRNEVFQMSAGQERSEVANPFNCIVGCNSCAYRCPTDAIEFPSREILQTIRSTFSG